MVSLPVRAGWAVLAVVSIAATQAFLLSRRVPEVSHSEYQKKATELKTRASWHYGYFSTIHGAVLVRAPHSPEYAAPQGTGDPELTAYMLRELDALPRRAVFEGFFYCVVALFLLFLIPWLWRLCLTLGGSRLWRAFAAGLLAAVSAVVITIPQTLKGYGWSAFTT